MTELWVVPVPRGYTALDAYYEVSTMGRLVEYRWWKPRFWRMRWATIEVDNAWDS